MKKKSTSELPPTEKIDRAEMADVMKSQAIARPFTNKFISFIYIKNSIIKVTFLSFILILSQDCIRSV